MPVLVRYESSCNLANHWRPRGIQPVKLDLDLDRIDLTVREQHWNRAARRGERVRFIEVVVEVGMLAGE